jgi:hypothetical protein
VLLSLSLAIVFPPFSKCDTRTRGVAGVRPGGTAEVVGQVQQGYGNSYAQSVNTFFDVLQTPGSSSSSGYGQPLEVQLDVVKEVSVGGKSQAQSVFDGDMLTTQKENYKVIFQSNIPCYMYIAQLDSTGKVDPLFPSKYASQRNPVQPYTAYSVPAEQWFYLDANTGVETLYFVASRERRPDLEDLFSRLESTNPSLVQQQAVSLQIYAPVMRGVGGVRQGGGTQAVRFQDGSQGQYASTLFSSIQADFVATRWFYHQ